MLHISKIFFKIWFPNDVSQSYMIYYFGKCVTISWDCNTSCMNQISEYFVGTSHFSNIKTRSKCSQSHLTFPLTPPSPSSNVTSHLSLSLSLKRSQFTLAAALPPSLLAGLRIPHHFFLAFCLPGTN